MYKFRKETAKVSPIIDGETTKPEPESEKYRESQNEKGVLVTDIWEFYKRVLTFPANTAGIERKFGFGLYFLSLLLGISFILKMYTEPTAYYTEGSLEFGKDVKVYQTPDIVICPDDDESYSLITEGYDYKVAYNEEAIQFLNMSRHHVNLLTKLKFDNCKNKTTCENMDKLCDGELMEYCEIIRNNTDQFAKVWLYYRWIRFGPLYHYRLRLTQTKEFTLETLWRLLLHQQHLEVSVSFQTNKRKCMLELDKNRTECIEKWLQMWVGKRLCWLLPTEEVITEYHTLSTVIMYTSITDYKYFVFWIGSLKSQTISSLQSLDRDSHRPRIVFSVTEFHGKTKTGTTCQEGTRRKQITCSENSDPEHQYYYEWHKGSEKVKYWNSAGIELDLISKRTIEIKPMFSGYTKFQIAAGVISCCVGHSIMQVLYLSLQKLRGKVKLKSLAETLLISIVFLFLFAGTIAMGRIDLKFYFENRYNFVFKEISTTNLNPAVEFHFDIDDFLNVAGKNVSSDFLKYLKLADSVNPKSSMNPVHYVPSELRNEARSLSHSLNFSTEASIAQLINALSPDREKFLQNCKIGQIPFDCKKILRFHRTRKNYMLLEITPRVLEIEHGSFDMAGIDGALTFSVDSDVIYRTFLSQPGLWEEWFITVQHSTFNQASTENIPYAKTFFYHQLWIQHIQIAVEFNHKLRSRKENNCLDEHERVFRRSPHEIYSILRSVQRNQWCGCVECFYGSIEDDMHSKIRQLSDRPLQCCTVTNLTECFASYVTKLGIADDSLISDEDQKDVSAKFYHGIHFEKLHAAMEDSNRTEFTEAELITIIEGYRNFPVNLRTRITEFLKQGFKKPCLEFGYDLSASNRVKKNFERLKKVFFSRYRYIDFAIYYKSPKIMGVVEVDRFNFSDFFGVLMCSFSFIFGIGIVGILEIMLTYVSICGKTKRKSAFVLREHLIRSMALFSNQKMKVSSENENEERTNVIVKSKLSLEDAMKERKFVSISELRIDDLESKVAGTAEATEDTQTMYEEYKLKIMCPSTTESQEGKTQEHIDRHGLEKWRNQQSENIRAILMLLTLSIASVVMIFMTLDFFSNLEKDEYNTEVISNPQYQPPSIVTCMKNFTEADLIFEENEKGSVCRIYGVPENLSCSSVFSVFFKNSENQSCFLSESIGERKLDPGEPDLEIIMNYYEQSTLSFAIFEPGTLQLHEISSTADFRQSLTIAYRFTKKIGSNNCISGLKKSEKLLRHCDAKDRDNGTACCVKSESCNEPVSVPDSCLRYHFTAETFYKFHYTLQLQQQQLTFIKKVTYNKKRLIIKPAQDFTIATTIKPKYDSLTIFSIVGGIVGSFVELTLLNCLSLLFIGTLQIKKTVFKK